MKIKTPPIHTTQRSGTFTYKDFRALIRDDQKADLIDGVIYVASPENTDANRLFGWLFSLMLDFADLKNLGLVLGSRVACRLDEHHAPEPDILFVRNENLHRVHRGGVEGPPDLAVEIVSPESVERDYHQKRRQYEQFGIPEYWIIDPDEQKVTLLRLDRKGKYRDVRSKKEVFTSQVLTGFWLDPNWLWQDPRPRKLEILRRVTEVAS